MGPTPIPPEIRFWAKVKKSRRGCWIWIGGSEAIGYGKFGIRAGAVVRAHRYSFELANGPIDDPEMCVCHKCDNRKCVRPDHLFLGTSAENQHDMRRKGRAARGMKNPAARYSEATIRLVRHLGATGITQRAIAAQVGMSNQHVSRVLKQQQRSAPPAQI